MWCSGVLVYQLSESFKVPSTERMRGGHGGGGTNVGSMAQRRWRAGKWMNDQRRAAAHSGCRACQFESGRDCDITRCPRGARDRAPVNAFTLSGLNKRRTSLRQTPDMARPTGCRWRRAIAGPMSTRARRRAPALVVHAICKILCRGTERGPACAPIRRCRPST